MSEARSLLPWPRAARRTAAVLPGLGVPPCAGSAHLVGSLKATATPAPRPIASADRRRGDGSGVALALILCVPFYVCLAVLIRIGWPHLRDAAGVIVDVLRMVQL